jgi:excisionase family DNA binding protein
MTLEQQIIDRLNAIAARQDELFNMLRFQLSHKDVLSMEEAAMYSCLSESTLYKLTASRKIKHSKPNGKMINIKRVDLEEYMLSNPVKTTDQVDIEAANHNFKSSHKKAS